MNKNYIDEFYKRMLDDEEYKIFTITLPMFLVKRSIYTKSEAFFKTNYDLLHSDIDVLASLYFVGQDYSLSPTELYDATVFSSGGMTKVLKKLENRGLIKRTSSLEDKRKVLVTLTQEGKALVEDSSKQIAKRFKEHFKVLSNKEQNELINILSKLLYSMT